MPPVPHLHSSPDLISVAEEATAETMAAFPAHGTYVVKVEYLWEKANSKIDWLYNVAQASETAKQEAEEPRGRLTFGKKRF